MGLSSVWGNIRGFTVTEYVRSRDSGIFQRWWAIKDIMGQQGKPDTLDKMRILAHSIDAWHWEQVHEKSRSGPDKSNNHNSNNSNKSDKKPQSNNSDKSSNNKNQSKGSSNNSNNNKDNKCKTVLNLLADKLGKDGKLTPQERQR